MAKLHHPHAGLLLVRNRKQIMIPLTKDVTTIGRKLADIILDDPKVSSRHAEIRRNGQRFHLIDHQSTNGTFVNRQQVQEIVLEDQDVVEIGLSTLCFFDDIREFHGEAEETSAATRPKEIFEPETKSGEYTMTKTISQACLDLEQLEGPDQGKRISFKRTHITVGRSDADLIILDLDVSRNHALFEVLGKNSVFLKDLESTNGTFLNGKRIQSEKISTGDTVGFGNTKWRIHIHLGEGQS
jgi:pSer/pThr/pTyr-binding forkhead associated (FHA) protein